MPVEPPPTDWVFPPADSAVGTDVVGVGADLEPGTLLAAYRAGLFPMRLGGGGPLAWWSPEPRGILPLDGLHVSRSLRRSLRRFTVSLDRDFEGVIRGCADERRPGGWIDDGFVAAYRGLHALGWAHSVEVWSGGELAGGLYGVRIGGMFAAESKFHRVTDASKVALVALVDHLRRDGARLIDVQWVTPHLASLGAVEVPRAEYLARLAEALGA
ncbi:MAG: leucyl/phenylalanyl-tRNA--protein transferase [Acidimicrobiia bacterium]|nr:leucyl/phenylalanyl-tRNA--protein transferase [Acidimicrobiia bacterium]